MESGINEFKEGLLNTLKEIAYPLVAILISVIAGGILVYSFGSCLLYTSDAADDCWSV